MGNTTAIIIIAALCAILPSIIVYVACWSRIISHESRINSALGAKEDIARIENDMRTVKNDMHELKYAFEQLDESFKHLTGKINAREKVNQAAERRAAKEEEQQQTAMSEPLTSPTLPFPPATRPTVIPTSRRYVVKQGG